MAGITLASELVPGSYVCLRTRSLFGWVIRAVTRSQFDHVILVTGPGQCTQATTRGVKTGPLSAFAGCQAVANAAEEMTARQRKAVVTYALACGGYEYQWQLIAVLGLRKAGVNWGWLLKASADKGAMICSELAASAGMSAPPPLTAWKCGYPSVLLVKPSDLAARDVMRPVAWD